ncbi:MAG: phosphate acyltransferase [Syntrophaceae bacterium]
MIKNFKQIMEKAQDNGRKKLAVPAPRSRRVSQFLEKAEKAGLIVPILVGEGGTDKPVTRDVVDAALVMTKNGEADILFQGDAHMQDFTDALTENEAAVGGRESLSYISLFELPSENRIFMLTDTLIQAFPDIKQKVRILENAIDFAMGLGIEKPKIAALSAAEIVNFNIPSSVDAAVLAQMSGRNQLKGIVDGPLDIDSASSRERCLRKGIKSPVAGQADIYFLPDIEAGYSIAEVLIFLGTSISAGALLGTKYPVVLNLRCESPDSLLLDMALASIRA